MPRKNKNAGPRDLFGKGPANFLKASSKRGYGASPTNFLLDKSKKRSAGKPPSEPVSP